MNSYGTSTLPGAGINPGHIHFVVPSRQAYMYLGGNASDINNWSEIDLSLKGTTGWETSSNNMFNSNSGQVGVIGTLTSGNTKFSSNFIKYEASVISNAQALAGEVTFYGVDTLNVGVGTAGRSTHLGAGTVVDFYGVFGISRNQATGTITNAYGVHSNVRNESTGIITNGYGFYADFDINTGTITNAYGIYINQVLGTNKWGLYVNDTSPNYFAGNVGIGISAPTSKLHIEETKIDLSGTVNGIQHTITVNPVSTSTAYTRSIKIEVKSDVNNTYGMLGLEGIAVDATHYGSGDISSLRGLIGRAKHYGTGTITSIATSVEGVTTNQSTGTIVTAKGLYAGITNVSTGSITTANALEILISNTTTGTITNAYGIYCNFYSNGGTITNAYGVYINQVLGTNKWALYSNDTSDSYFAGKVGIGTNVPTSALQVVGLPVYANNVAATNAGLTAGAFYRTGADPDPVCVVH